MKQKECKFYIDTNIVLDYITQRNKETCNLIQRIQEKEWQLNSSSFLLMELAHYKKDEIFIKRAIENKWEVRRILREVNNNKQGKGLQSKDYDDIANWSNKHLSNFTHFSLYEFIHTSDDWGLCSFISTNSELAPLDVLHLASAIIGSINKECDYLLTNDVLLKKEGNRIIKYLEIKNKIEILTVAQAKQKFFSK